MNKQAAVNFAKTIEKYGFALCSALHPSQIAKLQKALVCYQENERIPKLDDVFTDLAFRMIVSDLIWQEYHGKEDI